MARVSPQYVQGQTAADCTTAEPAAAEAPADKPAEVVAQFVEAAPCADGTAKPEGAGPSSAEATEGRH